MLIYTCEVDVVRDRRSRPWRAVTHHVEVGVKNQPSLFCADIEARTLAAWMCWHIRGEMVTAVRIIEVEL